MWGPLPSLYCLCCFFILLLSYHTSSHHLRRSTSKEEYMPSGHEGESLKYIIEGHLNLGAILPVHKHVEGQPCGSELRETGAVQNVEAIAYAIKKVNGDPNLLPGIRLGMVVLDDCATPVTALGRALHFMPVLVHNQPAQPEFCQDECSGPALDKRFTFYDVVGVIGAESSQSSIMISNVLGRFNLPMVSPMSTSDLLSNKLNYPYFMRMAPPDRYQVHAILQLLQHFQWTYFSVVYSKGGYGLNAAEHLQQLAALYGLCIGGSFPLPQVPSDNLLYDVLDALYVLQTRVVVLFTDQEETHALFRQTRRQGLRGHFVWVGSDGVGVNLDDLDGVEDCALGSLALKSYSVPVPTFQEYFEVLRPGHTKNPWFKHMWADLFRCTWEGKGWNASLPLCDPNSRLSESKDYHPESQVSTLIDTVYVFATALHRLVQRYCPQKTGDDVRDCVTGERLLKELNKTDMVGLGGNISFDHNGDIRGKYEVLNFRHDQNGEYETQRVALWDASTERLVINVSDIVWNQNALGGNQSHPVSSCGRKCLVGEIYSYYKNTCCWECRQCSPNQITTDNATKCVTCPRYTWPDQSNLSSCHPITPLYLEWHHPVVIVFVIMAVMGVSACTIVFFIFLRHNNARLIKATSRELSYILLGGITIQFVILLSSVSKPSPFVCVFNYFSFNVSFAIVYAPLLTRTNRIYRIFRAGKRTKRTPSLTSPLSQVIIALVLIALQVTINVLVIIINPPRVSLHMPVETDPHVELTCGIPVYNGLTISLCYNILLVLICTYYAFKTRTLPDNFNESRYITLCVYTTLVIWLAFVPTYFLTSRSYHKMILLASSLVLNASVLLMCLFTPKIYAIYHGATTVTFKYNLKVSQDTPSNAAVPSAARGSLDPATVSDFAMAIQADSRSNSNQSFCRNCQETMVAVNHTTTEC